MQPKTIPKELDSFTSIPFIDLVTQKDRIREDVLSAIERVIDHGAYVMGPEVDELEKKLAEFSQVKYALSCSNGTDALYLALMAKGIKKGQAVFMPSFTFAATAGSVALLGGTPVFVDVCPKSYNIDLQSLYDAIERIKNTELRAAGVMPVDLFGQPANYDAIHEIANQFNMWVISDAAQSYGATYQGRHVGQLAEITTTSFFPAKPLGCYGEGGAVFTNEDKLYEIMASIRCHGQGQSRYEHVRLGLNARLCTMQAAVLLEKIKIFQEELISRQKAAERYTQYLKDIVITPELAAGCTSSWAQYTIRVNNRDKVIEYLKEKKIPTGIYYPIPTNEQIAFRQFPVAPAGVNVAKKLSEEVLSLPMHAYLNESIQDYIIDNVRQAVALSA